MRFLPLSIPGAYLVELDRLQDERRILWRSWCSEEFAAHGLRPDLAQCNVSFTRRRGAVRGLHYQRPPHAEAKLVRCTQGAVCDVIVDLRPDSPARRRWAAVELSAENRSAVYVPEHCAHGFQTLTDDVELFYQMSTAYCPAAAAGVRFDDPAIGVRWPLPPTVVSEQDGGFPLLDAASQEASR